MKQQQSRLTEPLEPNSGETRSSSGEPTSSGESHLKDVSEEKPLTSKAARKKSRSKSSTKERGTSKSRKSESDSKPRIKKYQLNRLFHHRNVSIEPVSMDQMKYIWAAYRMGLWNDDFGKDLSKEDITLLIAKIAETRHVVMITAPNQGKEMPVALLIVREDNKILEPHLDWFPWATERNKIEGTIKLIIELRKIKPVWIWSKEETKEFFTYIAKYGVIRRVGTFYGDEQYSIFQSKEEK